MDITGTRKPAGKSKADTRADMGRGTGVGIYPRGGDGGLSSASAPAPPH